MAASDVDQMVLGQLAKSVPPSRLATALYQLLGLSVMLSKATFMARKKRKLDTTRDTKSLRLYQRIIWLADQGLTILKNEVLPFTEPGQHHGRAHTSSSNRIPTADTAAELFGIQRSTGVASELDVSAGIAKPELPVLAAKLHASFYHTFCLFHNSPQVRSVWPLNFAIDDLHQIAGNSEDLAAVELAAVMSSHNSSTRTVTTTAKDGFADPLPAASITARSRQAGGPQMGPYSGPLSPPLSPAASLKSLANGFIDDSEPVQAYQPRLPSREPVPSVASASSFLTNPFANMPPGTDIGLEPGEAHMWETLNQNLAAASAAAAATTAAIAAASETVSTGGPPARNGGPPARECATPVGRHKTPLQCLAKPASPAGFIMPAKNFVPDAEALFRHASELAAARLAPSHPLRLSVALEHAAFMWDVLHDYEGAKVLARIAIQLVSKDEQPLTDADFETAAVMVTLLGKLRRRSVPVSIVAQSLNETPRCDGPVVDGAVKPVQFNQKALDNLNGIAKEVGGSAVETPPIKTDLRMTPPPPPGPAQSGPSHLLQQAQFQARLRHSPDRFLREEYSLGESIRTVSARHRAAEAVVVSATAGQDQTDEGHSQAWMNSLRPDRYDQTSPTVPLQSPFHYKPPSSNRPRQTGPQPLNPAQRNQHSKAGRAGLSVPSAQSPLIVSSPDPTRNLNRPEQTNLSTRPSDDVRQMAQGNAVSGSVSRPDYRIHSQSRVRSL